MVSDSIPHASIAMASSNAKDFSKKKRANRKLRHCVNDARQKQWLSHVKNKGGCKEEANGEGGTHENPVPRDNLEIKPRIEEAIYRNDSSMHHYSDSELSPSNSPTSHSSSTLGSNDSGANFTASSSRSSSSNLFFSGSISDEDEGNIDDDDDGCFDDWESMADAMAAAEENQRKHKANSEKLSVKNQAWRPDDAFRPQSLPNLKGFDQEGSVWGSKSVDPVPTSCPICYEDLDCTDSSFLPCLCGFRLCLFCHKRILEEDGRCPGCRKQYDCGPVEGEKTLEGRNLIRLDCSCDLARSRGLGKESVS